FQVMVTSQWPLLLVVSVNGPAGVGMALYWMVRVTVSGTLFPYTTLFRSPAFCRTVTVKVWFWLTSLTALGAMLIWASSKVLVAGPLSTKPGSPLPSPVARARVLPLSVKVVLALPMTWPAVFQWKVTWTEP